MDVIRNKERTNGHSSQKAGLDELTGVWNRDGFIAAATPMFVSCQRRDAPIALAYFDFHTTDSGSAADDGTVDRVLMAMGELMRKAFRASDIVGRVGKLRFAVLLPDCTEEALAAVDGVRALNEASASPNQLTLTAGMVRSTPESTLEELMQAADARTKEIKRDS
jgi:diguanylate cyclase (GGDEF)-like protein